MGQLWQRFLSLLVGLAVLPQTLGFEFTPIPPPTGRYKVGKKKFQIDYINTGDLLSPNNVSTAFLATVFYPTKVQGPTQPYLDPVTAELYAAVYNVSTDALTSLTSTLAIDAPALAVPGTPTLLFGPGGGGPPVEVYTILLSELASHGWTVIGTDHPYEQPFIRWPNGTGLYGLPILYDGPLDEGVLGYTRMNETKAMIDRLHVVEQGLGVSISHTLIGAFGHSFGGETAVGAAINDTRILSSINMDGSFFGDLAANDSSVDVKSPVWLMGSGAHDVVGADPSWVTFPEQQTGWWRLTIFNGSKHVDLSDITIWKATRGVHSANLGTIDGYRMVNLTRTWTKAFFEFTLLGSRKAEAMFNGPSAEWPEVEFRSGSNGTA
ncbi:hypothetical protein BX600DRAFT_472035 [Xylariales sp. PMI_506]|nr:hypothetical protein BX600DRAFT_472035 [Xylariales sp. PMI_506]